MSLVATIYTRFNMSEQQPKKRGFAAMSPEQLRQIASSGGIARREAYKVARQHGRSGNGLPLNPPAQPKPPGAVA
jgi:hypothetical protein